MHARVCFCRAVESTHFVGHLAGVEVVVVGLSSMVCIVIILQVLQGSGVLAAH